MALSDFTIKRLNGEAGELGQYEGQVVLVVNVASECGFTPQYEGLEALYQKYKDRGFVILGFPCNQFGEQEPGSEEEIEAFCQRNYSVTFPLFEKIDVNGPDAHPLYAWLKAQQPDEFIDVPEDHKYYSFFKDYHGGDYGNEISWNFNKFLLNREGKVVGRYASPTTPEELEPKIEDLL